MKSVAPVLKGSVSSNVLLSIVSQYIVYNEYLSPASLI